MGRLSPSDKPVALHSAVAGALTVDYCEAPPGQKRAETDHFHCLIIPIQEHPLRIITTRDGAEQFLTLESGDIALAPKGSHTIWQWLDPAKIILIRLEPNAFRQFIELEMRLVLTSNSLQNEVMVRDPNLTAAAQQLLKAKQQDDVGSDILFEALARVFLVNLVRRYGTYDPNAATGFSLEDYIRVLNYIESRLEDRITPNTLATLVGMSEASFARKFKERTGQSPMAFVREARLSSALEHLKDGQLSLGQIAARCGFSDQAHFSRVFKSAHGKTPGRYRKTWRT